MAHTPWAAYNAVSEWADHQRSFRGATEQHRAESRLNSVWFGSSNQIKQRAYSEALELAGVRGARLNARSADAHAWSGISPTASRR